MAEIKLHQASLHICEVTAKTRWIFISLVTQCGITGYGEATLSGQENAVSELFAHYARRYLKQNGAAPRAFFPAIDSLPLAALASGLDQALWDIKGKQAGQGLSSMLTADPAAEIEVYANINRKTSSRSAEEFAENALKAKQEGHVAFKLAPFDEVNCHAANAVPFPAAVKPGLKRIEKVREAIGDRARLMVDCHWRLDAASANQLIDFLSDYQLYWLECPVPETPENIGAIAALKQRANQQGMLLAGFEEYIRLDAFQPWIHHNSCDIYMPDAKYAGGMREMMDIASAIRQRRGVFSPHNPSGPVCDAVSTHLCAANPQSGMLEMQYDETPLFHALTDSEPKIINNGRIGVSDRPGHGVDLNGELLERLSVYRVDIGL